MDKRMKEAIRYLGYGNHAVDNKTQLLIRECFEELEQIAELKCVYRIFEPIYLDNETIKIGTMNVQSKHLNRNLDKCHFVALMGATLGVEVDNILRKYEIINIAKAVVFQACSAAYLEEYCDKMQEEIRSEYHARPRFSPGYGDFSIQHQKHILNMLEAPKRIGLSMTEGCMLVPTKSVTAVIGLEKTKEEKKYVAE